MSGKKYDEGKIRYDLIPPEAKRSLASQLTFGADKYGDRNWEAGLHFHRLVRAADGHLTEWWAGNDLDEEGRPHLNGAITSLAMLIALVARFSGTEFDDRPVKLNPQSTPNMGAQMQRVAKHVAENDFAASEFLEMMKAAKEAPPEPQVIELSKEDMESFVAGFNTKILTYDPGEFTGFTVEYSDATGVNTTIPPVEQVENSAKTDQSTGGNTHIPKYVHKVHYQTSVFGEIMCDTKNIKKMSDRANDVTCGRCLKMMG